MPALQERIGARTKLVRFFAPAQFGRGNTRQHDQFAKYSSFEKRAGIQLGSESNGSVFKLEKNSLKLTEAGRVPRSYHGIPQFAQRS